MALITCPDCGAQVSDRAKSCIHCGAPLIAEENIHKIRTAKNEEVIVNVTYKFYDDSTGKLLASGTKNSLVTIKLDKPTRIRAHRSGLGWKDFYLDYTPNGLSKYQIVQKRGFMKEWMEFQEVEVFDSADESQPVAKGADQVCSLVLYQFRTVRLHQQKQRENRICHRFCYRKNSSCG